MSVHDVEVVADWLRITESGRVGPLQWSTAVDIGNRADEEAIYQQWLPHWHPEHKRGFRYLPKTNEIDLRWNRLRNPYWIDLDRISSPLWLLHWIAHLGEKGWPHMTPDRVRSFIEFVCWKKGWNLWEPHHLAERETSATAERAKLTPRLRWRVLKRDGFRCRACGSGPEHGAVLHIDHIEPIALGGVTSFENLQTLCAGCNAGKGSKA